MAFKAIALTGKKIVRSTFRSDMEATRYVSPTRVTRAPTGFACTTVTKMPKQRVRYHKVRVQMPKTFKGRFIDCKDVKIDCDCERYVFVWNYALVQKNAAIKDRTNHEPPEITNPQGLPGACKHLLVVLQLLIAINPVWPHRTKSPVK